MCARERERGVREVRQERVIKIKKERDRDRDRDRGRERKTVPASLDTPTTGTSEAQASGQPVQEESKEKIERERVINYFRSPLENQSLLPTRRPNSNATLGLEDEPNRSTTCGHFITSPLYLWTSFRWVSPSPHANCLAGPGSQVQKTGSCSSPFQCVFAISKV